nr:hypothetical protein Iba_chr03aCG19720 [Ipomoea batatas]
MVGIHVGQALQDKGGSEEKSNRSQKKKRVLARISNPIAQKKKSNKLRKLRGFGVILCCENTLYYNTPFIPAYYILIYCSRSMNLKVKVRGSGLGTNKMDQPALTVLLESSEAL